MDNNLIQISTVSLLIIIIRPNMNINKQIHTKNCFYQQIVEVFSKNVNLDKNSNEISNDLLVTSILLDSVQINIPAKN